MLDSSGHQSGLVHSSSHADSVACKYDAVNVEPKVRQRSSIGEVFLDTMRLCCSAQMPLINQRSSF